MPGFFGTGVGDGLAAGVGDGEAAAVILVEFIIGLAVSIFGASATAFDLTGVGEGVGVGGGFGGLYCSAIVGFESMRVGSFASRLSSAASSIESGSSCCSM